MQTIEAIFQNGVFKPLQPVTDEVQEGETVVIRVEERPKSSDRIKKLASEVYEGLSDEDIKEIERIALDRSSFFGDRTI